jgi:VWFA-related protein
MRASSLGWAAALGGLTAVLLAAPTPAAAGGTGAAEYHVEVDPNIVASHEHEGKRGTFVTAHFKVTHAADGAPALDITRDDLSVLEDGKPVAEFEILLPKAQGLTTVVAMDISGSMDSSNKIIEARKAANTFFDKLDAKADSGLILFDHLLRLKEPPGRDPAQFAAHRELLHQKVNAAKPGGGTAYLDATAEGLRMLQGVSGRKAVVLMTDGVDMNSVQTQQQVIEQAKASQTPVYTIGIGEPGKNEPVTTVLVLDHSGSMAAKAEEGDPKSKIQALREAASRFVELMRPTAKTTLLPFSSDIELPQPFSDKKEALKERIRQLEPESGTLLYDATWTGVETLAAARPKGKKAVVVLTDGVDESPGSRRTDLDVIDAAQAAGVQLYMLGLGRSEEINEPVMKKIAKATGGEYFHAENQQKLYDIFEKLSIDLHDDGIDEQALKTLADQTGGKYYPGRDVSKLALITEELSEDLASTYTVIYPSRHPDDGTARQVKVLVSRNGRVVSEGGEAGYTVHGVIVPEMDHRVYLVLLVGLGLLLAAPAGVRRLYRSFGGG